MEVVNNYEEKNNFFADLGEGDVFLCYDKPMMKLDEYLEADGIHGVNAVFLETGETLWIKDTEKITIVNHATLTIN